MIERNVITTQVTTLRHQAQRLVAEYADGVAELVKWTLPALDEGEPLPEVVAFDCTIPWGEGELGARDIADDVAWVAALADGHAEVVAGLREDLADSDAWPLLRGLVDDMAKVLRRYTVALRAQARRSLSDFQPTGCDNGRRGCRTSL